MNPDLAEVIALLTRIADALDQRDQHVETVPTNEQLQKMADANREHAAERYSDELIYNPRLEQYITRDAGLPVVFTPYGWQVENDEA